MRWTESSGKEVLDVERNTGLGGKGMDPKRIIGYAQMNCRMHLRYFMLGKLRVRSLDCAMDR